MDLTRHHGERSRGENEGKDDEQEEPKEAIRKLHRFRDVLLLAAVHIPGAGFTTPRVHKKRAAQASSRVYFTILYGAFHLIITRALETIRLGHLILVIIRIFFAVVVVSA